MVPAEFVLGAVAMLSNPLTEFPNLVDEVRSRHLIEIGVHLASRSSLALQQRIRTSQSPLRPESAEEVDVSGQPKRLRRGQQRGRNESAIWAYESTIPASFS
jgi:hypothetical protein